MKANKKTSQKLQVLNKQDMQKVKGGTEKEPAEKLRCSHSITINP
ncbi:MAG: hypothetical protein AAFQ83_00180 [Bacteroidota bacterium]